MIKRFELPVALALTAVAAGFHLIFLGHAGGLWRDEVGTINLAVMPHVSDVWAHLHVDSFPILWFLVVRVWSAIGLRSDDAMRVLGFLSGISVLGALWINAAWTKIRVPLFSTLLIGFSSTIIVWGDSIRAWGFGAFWILLTSGLIWRVVESPARGNVILAAMAAVMSVQSTYYNAVLLLAIGLGGAVVTLRRRLWRRCALVLAIGSVAALSLLPYVGVLGRGADNYLIVQMPFGGARFLSKIGEAMSGAGEDAVLVWTLLLGAAVMVGIGCQFRPLIFKATASQMDLLLFSVVTLIVAAGGYYLFLRHLQFVTQPWYYVGLLALAGFSIDATLSVIANWEGGRMVRMAVVILFAGLFFLPVNSLIRNRMTNVDVIARHLQTAAVKGDLILLNPWYCGITFQRYYSGAATWTGVPDVGDYTTLRYDVVKQLMMRPDQEQVMRTLCDKITETLKSGNRVWLAGGLEVPPAGQAPPVFAPAPSEPWGWEHDIYDQAWVMQAGYFVQSHAAKIDPVDLRMKESAIALENLQLAVVEGWRDN